MTTRHDLALVPLPASDRPALFEAFDDAVVERCKELWMGDASRSAPRAVALYAAEVPDGAQVPSPQSVRRWAAEEGWGAEADGAISTTRNRTLAQFRRDVIVGAALAQSVVLDGMAGLLDDLPYGGSGRLKAAELALKTAERAGLLTHFDREPVPEAAEIDVESMTTEEKQAFARQVLQQRKGTM